MGASANVYSKDRNDEKRILRVFFLDGNVALKVFKRNPWRSNRSLIRL